MIVEIFSNTRHRIISTVEFEGKDTIFEIVLNCIENLVSYFYSIRIFSYTRSMTSL